MSAFKVVPKTGVILVNQLAAKHGFYRGHPDFCNLGQGQPETGFIEGGIERIADIHIDELDQEYAPVGGLKELRQAIADMYNELYRKDKGQKYTADNVSVAAGGRAALTRLAASIDNINLGHFLPDYTAYEELLTTFNSFNTIPILLDPDNGYAFSVEDLRKEIQGKGLSALLISNPCNPTGATIYGRQLKGWVEAAKELECSIVFDEFYSSYVYQGVKKGDTLSCAKYIEDIENDNVVIVNGLGKNWRYPGWRIAWVVGPKDFIKSINSAGSFLDGGAPRPLQRAVIPLMHPDKVRKEALALQKEFGRKRQLMLDGLREIGVTFDREPGGSFYLWGNVSDLPEGINTGMSFLEKALEKKVIVVPGEAFDVNPGKRMKKAGSRFKNYLRFSYGPKYEDLEEALRRLKEMVEEHKKHNP